MSEQSEVNLCLWNGAGGAGAAGPQAGGGAAPEEGLRRQTNQDLPDNEILREQGATVGRCCHDSGRDWILEKSEMEKDPLWLY